MASTIAEVSGSYASATNTTGGAPVATWGSGRVGSNAGLLLAFTHTIFGSGVGATGQTLSGWTLASTSTSGNTRSCLFYKAATSSDIPANTVSFTGLPISYTIASTSGNGTTQTYVTSGSGTTQPFVVGQSVNVTGAGGYNISGVITAIGGSSNAWSFGVAGTVTSASQTGSVQYSSVTRCQLSLYEVSGADVSQFDITPLVTNNTSVSASPGGVTVGSSSAMHLSGGAFGMLFVGINSSYSGTPVFSISPSGLNTVTHATTSGLTVSSLAAFYKFADMTATDVGSAVASVTWASGSRNFTGIYVAARPLYSGADTGAGVDTTDGFTWDLSSSDGSSGADTFAASTTIPVADGPQNSGADTAQLDVSLTNADAGSGADSFTIERGAFDTGSGANSASVVSGLTPSVNDAGSGNDSSGITIIETISASDYGNGFEAVNAVIPKPYFTPPTVKDIAPYLPDSSGLQVRLFRHYATRYRGVNVFLLSDGTFVQDTATVENGNTGYPLPWIINDPANEYLTVFNIDGSVTNTLLNPHIAKVYEGGHRHPLTQDEAVALAAAGYYVEYV